MLTRKIPQSINVIVNSVKGIKPKKNEFCKFQVVFGVSKKKFQTEIVEDFHGCPIFNTEADIPISLHDTSLKLKLLEKSTGDVLSKMVVSLLDIPHKQSDSSFTVGMRDKGGDLVAEINFNAYVTSFHTSCQQSLDSTLNKSSLSLGISKLKDRFGLLKRNDSNPNMQRRTTNPKVMSGLVLEENSLKTSSSCTDLSNIMSPFVDDDDDVKKNEEGESLKPEVSGVSPREGSTDGGTKLVIRGRNLGVNKDDIIGLYICGSNVLSTLQYFSSAKLACVTKACKAGEGNISVETQSGGVGSSLVKFTFIEAAKQMQVCNEARRGSDVSNMSFKSQDDQPISMRAVVMAPEVTGVSPNEGAYNEVTKVTIRGSHLGIDADDVLKIMICGKDWRGSMEEHKGSKIVCRVGPVLKVSRGEIMVETASGGVGCSTVEFKLVDRRSDAEKMNCSGKRKNYSRQHHLNSCDDSHSSFDASPSITFHPTTTAPHSTTTILHSTSTTPHSTTTILHSTSTTPHPTTHQFSATTTPNPTAHQTSSPTHHTSTTTTPISNTNPFATAYVPPTINDVIHDDVTSQNIPRGDDWCEGEVKEEREEDRNMQHDDGVPLKNKEQKRITFPATSHDPISKPPIGQIQPMLNHSVKAKEKDELICKMEAKLKLRETEIEELITCNRELRDEVGRLKNYIEDLLNKAIIHCPNILAIQ